MTSTSKPSVLSFLSCASRPGMENGYTSVPSRHLMGFVLKSRGTTISPSPFLPASALQSAGARGPTSLRCPDREHHGQFDSQSGIAPFLACINAEPTHLSFTPSSEAPAAAAPTTAARRA